MAISLRKAVDVIVNGPEQDCIVLVSPPGTGKSSAVIAAAKRMGAQYLPVYAATMEAVDARGLPYLKDAGEHKLVGWAAPSFLPLEIEVCKHSGNVLVNFDDWFQAPPPVLRATVRSIYGDGGQRRIGDFPIYANTRFVATGNREQDRAGVYRPETYVNDRITYIEIEPDVDDWVTGALNGFALPPQDSGYTEQRERINKNVALGVPDVLVAYVKWAKQVYDFQSEQRSFLSPRSIERLGRFMRAFDAAGIINGDMLQEVANGTVGDVQAAKFMAFYKLREQLPDMDDILAGKDVKLPVRTEILFILATTVARSARKDNVEAVVKLMQRMAEAKSRNGEYVGVEASVYLANECLNGANQALRGIRGVKAFFEWAQVNAKFFLT